ncbi:MAG: PIN domain-containing protein [Chitinophagaceae bacterium]|nr:PIN domain-containing protein [Anaerolineae bacterium]
MNHEAVADTSFAVALGNKNDPDHQACRLVHQQQRLIYLPQSTLTEVLFMLRRELGSRAAADYLEHLDLPISKFQIIPLTSEDRIRTIQLLRTYADSRVDFVDASIAAVAERLDIRRILTLDQRDFRIIRPSHIDYFELLPDI